MTIAIRYVKDQVRTSHKRAARSLAESVAGPAPGRRPAPGAVLPAVMLQARDAHRALPHEVTDARLSASGRCNKEARWDLLVVDVDARTVTFMDSTVIAAIAHLAHRIPDRVRFLLEVTHIGEVVDVVDQDPGFPGTPFSDSPPPAA